MIERRVIITGALAAPFLGAAATDGAKLRSHMEALERSSGGRLGVAVLDTGNGKTFDWRGGEIFAFCSMFKFLLATAVLQRVDRGQEWLDRLVAVSQSDLLPHSPLSEKYVRAAGAPVSVLAQAVVEVSDNAAANLLLASLGGPAGLTRMIRSWGDPVTRLDRTELALNEAAPGDPRDTTSPQAMLKDLRRIALGDVLTSASRALIVDWLENCQTGQTRLRAGLPAGWVAGDKTGTSGRGTSNDLAIAWPPGRPPILLVCLLTGATVAQPQQDAIHAEVARAVVAALFS
jgi:beta-lactamase class A